MAKKIVEAEVVTVAEETDPPYGNCYACGFPVGKPGRIPKVEYTNGDNEEPVQPFAKGTKPCNDPCHKA